MQSKVNNPVGDASKTEATKQDQAAKNPESPAAAGGAAAAGAESAVPSVGTVLEAAEELWPQSLAEDWDAVGLSPGAPPRASRRSSSPWIPPSRSSRTRSSAARTC